MAYYVDVHTHLTHEDFRSDLASVIKDCVDAGVGAMVVNGLEPESNRQILELAKIYPQIKAAAGIYPTQAVHPYLEGDLALKTKPFSIPDAINEIKQLAETKQIIAVGECGLDGYWLDASYTTKQEKVFESLLEIAKDNNIPAIIHSRKLERRAFEICAALGMKKVNFHCYTGKTNLAVSMAEKHPWYFSIPANSIRSESFQKLMKSLPKEQILTETDAPYLAPVANTRNLPKNVIGTVELFANLRNLDLNDAKEIIWQNYLDLFSLN